MISKTQCCFCHELGEAAFSEGEDADEGWVLCREHSEKFVRSNQLRKGVLFARMKASGSPTKL